MGSAPISHDLPEAARHTAERAAPPPAHQEGQPRRQAESVRPVEPAAPRWDWYQPPKRDIPSIFEAMKAAREKAEESAKRYKVKSSVRYGDLPITAFAKLARARNKAEVSSATGYARRQLARLRCALRQEGADKDAIRTAMNQLEKVALRANRKKRDIDREQLIQLQRRRAAEREREDEARRLQMEVQRKRALRVIREGGYISEAVIAKGMQAYRAAEAAKYDLPGGTPAPLGSGPVPVGAVSPAAAPAAFSAPMPAEGSLDVQA